MLGIFILHLWGSQLNTLTTFIQHINYYHVCLIFDWWVLLSKPNPPSPPRKTTSLAFYQEPTLTTMLLYAHFDNGGQFWAANMMNYEKHFQVYGLMPPPTVEYTMLTHSEIMTECIRQWSVAIYMLLSYETGAFSVMHTTGQTLHYPIVRL